MTEKTSTCERCGRAHVMKSGHVSCAAHNRRGEPCGLAPTPGYRVCARHGSKSPRGLASSRWKHGRYSEVLKGLPIGERVERARNDTELLALRDEVALLRAYQEQLLEKASTNESGATWRALVKALDDFESAERRAATTDSERQQQARDMALHLDAMRGLIRRGAGEYAIWDDVMRVQAQAVRVGESERKREIEARLVMGMDQVAALIAVLADGVNRYVANPRERAQVADHIDQHWSGRWLGARRDDQADGRRAGGAD